MRLRTNLTVNQLNRISNIFDNTGNIIFGVSVLSPIISDFDRETGIVVILGVPATLFCWVLSVWLARRK